MNSMCKWFVANTVFRAKINDSLSILAANYKLKSVKSCKYLDVIIDENLKWVDHIDYLYKKICQVCWYLL
jgi:hypothetical protein